MASTAGIALATSTFARWRSDLTELRGQLALGHMASVIGLAPIRPDLKGRLRELLCIHGQKWSPRLVSRQRLLVFSEALICLSYSGMVVPAGNAPASSGYQPGALLLSYETMADGVGIAPTQPGGSLGFRDRGITAVPTIRNGQGGRNCTCVLLLPREAVCC